MLFCFLLLQLVFSQNSVQQSLVPHNLDTTVPHQLKKKKRKKLKKNQLTFPKDTLHFSDETDFSNVIGKHLIFLMLCHFLSVSREGGLH